MALIECDNGPFLPLVSLFYITLKDILISYETLIQYNKGNSD